MDRDDDFLAIVLATLARWDRSSPPGPERDHGSTRSLAEVRKTPSLPRRARDRGR